MSLDMELLFDYAITFANGYAIGYVSSHVLVIEFTPILTIAYGNNCHVRHWTQD